jgi:hypothetical protein
MFLELLFLRRARMTLSQSEDFFGSIEVYFQVKIGKIFLIEIFSKFFFRRESMRGTKIRLNDSECCNHAGVSHMKGHIANET